MNLFLISTSLRAVYLWVDGYERSALAAFHRRAGEKVHVVIKIAP